MTRRAQRGFSLIELMVAMTITVIISGAIYGLLSTGQSAFRREPLLVDRQQSIRIAMDLIVRDIENAGAGMTTVPGNMPQIFTTGLNNPCGGNACPITDSVRSEIIPTESADYIEMMSDDGTCPTLSICGGNGNVVRTAEPLPACVSGAPGFAFVSGTNGPAGSPGGARPGLVYYTVGGGGCGHANGGSVTLPAGAAAVYNPGTFATLCQNPPGGAGDPVTPIAPPGPVLPLNNSASFTYCGAISRMQLVRYEIAGENPAQPVSFTANPPNYPAMWRSEYGRRSVDLTVNAKPWIGTDAGGNQSPWQLVARGIDDMQIEYYFGAVCPPTGVAGPGWCPVPPVAINGDFTTVVQLVRITLSARALAAAPPFGQGVGGENMYAPGGTLGRRGQLRATVAPRQALMMLAQAGPGQWR